MVVQVSSIHEKEKSLKINNYGYFCRKVSGNEQ